MAIGRIISKKICLNKAVNEQLLSDSCRLAFTWTITHLDRDGRVHGDPRVLRSIIFPRRKDITDEVMEGFIREWVKCRLVIWYKSDGDKWLQFPKFRANQPKLRYERETPSLIPPPEEGKLCGGTPATVRQGSGNSPATVRPNIREEKLREEKRREEKLSDKTKKPEQAPFQKDQPDDSSSPAVDNGSKSRDRQLAELAVRLKIEDPQAYKKLMKQYPKLKNTGIPPPPWDPLDKK